MRTFRLPVRAVLYREEGSWVAHCLEFDLCGDGDTPNEAFQSLMEAISIQIEETIESGNARNLFTPADGVFFEMFAAGKNVAVGEIATKNMAHGEIEIERMETREYSDGDLAYA